MASAQLVLLTSAGSSHPLWREWLLELHLAHGVASEEIAEHDSALREFIGELRSLGLKPVVLREADGRASAEGAIFSGLVEGIRVRNETQCWLSLLASASAELANRAAVSPRFAVFVGDRRVLAQNERPYSASVLHLLFGAIASVTLLGVARVDPVTEHAVVEGVAELALVIAVFGAGLAIDRHISKHSKLEIAGPGNRRHAADDGGDRGVRRAGHRPAARCRATAPRDPRPDEPGPRGTWASITRSRP